jgi:hypothetical protein
MSNIIKLTLSINGRTVSSIAALDDDLIANSRGPMALYSACLGVLKEVTQALWMRTKEQQWNGVSDADA